MKSLMLLGIVSLSLYACGNDDPPLTDLGGIYAISSWTHNSTACDVVGAEETPPFSHFMVYEATFLVSFVQFAFCESVTACREQIDRNSIALGNGAVFDDGSDVQGWTSRFITATSTDDACTGVYIDQFLSNPTSEVVQFTSRTKIIESFPRDTDDACTIEAVEERAGDVPCSDLSVATGDLVESI